MGFYIRKSIKVGPLRFNLSKSGVGVSAGIRGMRVGAGPRGNYVHMGRHGLYYRATLPGLGGGGPVRQPALAPGGGPAAVPPEDSLREIESGSVAEMRDASSAALLSEIQEKQRKTSLTPIVAVLGVAAVAAAAYVTSTYPFPPELPEWLPGLVPLVLIVATGVAVLWARRRDELAKSVVLFYELEADAEREYQELHDAFAQLSACAAVWHVTASRAIEDWKKSAGATTAIERKSIKLGTAAPAIIKTNISVPCIPCGREKLYLFPDRVLVMTASGVGAVGYSDLQLEAGASRFVERERVPSDAQVVGSTWHYVNKKGGPDKRFKNNREIPLVIYGSLHLRSASGLNEMLQFSKSGVEERFIGAVQRLAVAAKQGTPAT